MTSTTRARFKNAALIVLTAAAGLAMRAFKHRFPVALDAAGDCVWATMVYFLISFASPMTPIVQRAVAALTIAFAVEFSQLYHAPWIDRIRKLPLGPMILGFTFDWMDLIWYTLGVLLGVFASRRN